MKVTVVSPADADPREAAALPALFDAGLERYHVRKPGWNEVRTESWLRAIPAARHPQLVLHGHPGLAARLGLAHHAKDRGGDPTPARGRSCHDLPTLEQRLPRYAELFFGPVFGSRSKAGYGPAADFPWGELRRLLTRRSGGAAEVYAIGGVTVAGLARCQDLGFDGAAALGAVWTAPDPVAAFRALRDAAALLEANRHAA